MKVTVIACSFVRRTGDEKISQSEMGLAICLRTFTMMDIDVILDANGQPVSKDSVWSYSLHLHRGVAIFDLGEAR